MGIIFLASSFSLILGWCGISFFFLNHVEYFFLRKFEKDENVPEICSLKSNE